MRNLGTLSALIEHIYDAAVEPLLWESVLGAVRSFVDGSAAALFSKDLQNQSGNLYYHDGSLESHYHERYFSEYVRLDPLTTAQFFAQIGEPVATSDLMPYDEFLATRIYREWAEPEGLVDCVVVALDKSAHSFATMGVFRHRRQGVADEGTRERLRIIAPHVRRAVLIGNVIDLKATEATNLTAAFDAVTSAVLLVDRSGRVVHANASAHRMISMGEVMSAPNGRLLVSDAQADASLREVCDAAAEGDASMGTRGISIPLSSTNGGRYVAHVLSLTSGARRRAGTHYSAVAAIFIHRASAVTVAPPEAIAKHFELTPSELRVLLAIVQADGVAETAALLGISEATVKTHLHRLFAKTGTNRQADLVRLIASYSNPLLT